VVLDEFRAYCLNLLAPILTATPAARRLYAPEGRLLTLGETLTMGDFANALEYLIQAGPEDFYQGDMARQIVKDCAEQGGYLTLEDLQSYRVVERRPLQIQYRGTTLLTNPPPSSGGTLIAFALQLLATIDLAAYPHGSPEHLQILAQVMRLTNEARRDGLDANLYQPTIAEWFLGPDHVSPYQQALQSSVNKWGSTTQVSVIDTEGNAVSITSSNGEGSSYIIPGTDIMVNNMLGEEDLNPYGFHQWQPNQRISSMMAPTIVLQNHQPELALGSGGSNRIRTAILQVISNVVDFHLPIAEAVMAPRIHWERGAFHLEPGYDREGLTPLLSQTPDELVWWQQQNMFFGGVHGVCRQADGSLMGAGDSRRGGAVAAYFP
jgi:gamma-glutamyltranspeptidase/glutathione hydrolase